MPRSGSSSSGCERARARPRDGAAEVTRFDACQLATNAEVSQIAEERPEIAKFWSAPTASFGGSHCDYDGGSIRVYQGKASAAAFESTLKAYRTQGAEGSGAGHRRQGLLHDSLAERRVQPPGPARRVRGAASAAAHPRRQRQRADRGDAAAARAARQAGAAAASLTGGRAHESSRTARGRGRRLPRCLRLGPRARVH